MKQLVLKLASMTLAIITASFGFVGCSALSGESQTEDSSSSNIAETDPFTDYRPESVFVYLTTDLEKQDYGKTVTQLYRGPDQRMSHEIYIKDGDQSPDVIDRAIFQKNSDVQKYLGVTFEFVPADGSAHGSELIKKLETSVRASSNDYQIVSNSNYGTVNTMLTGAFLNLNHVEHLDLSKKYWSQYINNSAEVSGAIFGVTGSISLYLYQELFVCFFNRTLCEERGIASEDLYQTVFDGDWTLDYMINLTKNIYKDLNENKKADIGDQFGFAMQLTSATDAFWSSCNIQMTTKDVGTGKLQVNVDTKKLSNVVKKLNNFVWNSDGVLRLVEDKDFESETRGLYTSHGSTLIAKDQVLFATDRLYEICEEDLKGCDHYGVLPYPKYDAGQVLYFSCAHDAYTVFMIPFTAKSESEVCGAVLECLAVTNHNVVMPEYYNEVLTPRYAKDPRSIEMMNIIFQNIKMDAGLVFELGGLSFSMLRSSVLSNYNSVNSVYNSNKKSAVAQCNKITTCYNNYVNN